MRQDIQSLHELIMQRMNALDYKSDPLGVCYGVARMAGQAIMAGQIAIFYARIDFLIRTRSWDDQQFLEAYKAAKNKRKRKEELTTDEEYLLDLWPFFDGIQLYQSPEKHPEFFPDGRRPTSQSLAITAPLVLPLCFDRGQTSCVADTGTVTTASACLDPAGDDSPTHAAMASSTVVEEHSPRAIRASKQVSGVYTHDQLRAYLETLRTEADAHPACLPLVIRLGNFDHTVVIGYDPSQGVHPWMFVDANELEDEGLRALQATDYDTIAQSIFDGLGIRNQLVVMSTELIAFCTQNEIDCLSRALCANPTNQQHSTVIPTNEYALQLWLYIASIIGDEQAVKELISRDVSPNFICKDSGHSPLHIAVQNGHYEIVCELLKKGADPNIGRFDGATPLHFAAESGDLVVVSALLKCRANPNSKDKGGVTPLYIAAENGHLQVVVELLTYDALNPDVQDINGATPLHVAAANGELEVVRELLRYDETNPDVQDINGATPLYIAAQKGHLGVVHALLNANADHNLSRSNVATPLLIAVQNGHYEIVCELLKKGADPK